MRVVGRDRLLEAIEAGDIPAAPARAWLAEAIEARWAKPKEVLKFYRDAEVDEMGSVWVPLDKVDNCVIFLVDYRCGLIVVLFAGRKGRYEMQKRRIGSRP